MNPLQFELERCVELFKTRRLEGNDSCAQSVLIEMLIRLNFVLQKLDKDGARVSFQEDIPEGDITKLVNDMRNAVCHIESPLNRAGDNVLRYNKFTGYCPDAIRFNQIVLGCNYEDDTTFNFGDKIIYLHRHIGRLLEELPPLVAKMYQKKNPSNIRSC